MTTSPIWRLTEDIWASENSNNDFNMSRYFLDTSRILFFFCFRLQESDEGAEDDDVDDDDEDDEDNEDDDDDDIEIVLSGDDEDSDDDSDTMVF